jgi:hypothetical protein
MKRNRRAAGSVVSVVASWAALAVACGSDAGRALQAGEAPAADRPASAAAAPDEQPWIGAISASDRSVVPASEPRDPGSAAAAAEETAPGEAPADEEEVAPDEAAPEAPLPEEAAPEVTVSATSNDDEAALAHDDDASTWWSPAQDRDVITLSLGAVRSVSEIVMTTNTGFTLAGDSAAFADSPLEITSDGESWVAVPLINFNNLENSCDVSRLSVGSIACGFDPPRSLSQVRFEIRQEQLNGVPSVQELRIYELDAVLIDSPR